MQLCIGELVYKLQVTTAAARLFLLETNH